ncbi:MAG: hypothetical protein JSV23_08785 [Promethearchaeota archaeon]|nr:MAG: hypothetical protein JSV23_08785 [Candidatus Lokiarchaeota archaeon]
MPLRFNTCPHCNKKIIFKIEMDDINSNQYPAPVYIKCKSCNKLSTFYVDSLLRVSYKELDKKLGGIKTIETK